MKDEEEGREREGKSVKDEGGKRKQKGKKTKEEENNENTKKGIREKNKTY